MEDQYEKDCICTSNEQSGNEIKKTIQFTMVSKE